MGTVFPVLEVEAKLQVFDKTRLNGTKSFKTEDVNAVTLIEIQPDAAAAFIEVGTVDPMDSEKWYLDWLYTTAGTKVVTLRITADGDVYTKTASIEVVTVASENLFSKDSDLTSHHADILKYVAEGRASHVEKHRMAQEIILDEIYKKQILADDGSKLTAAEVIDVAEVKQWSKYMVLEMIFDDVSNATDDVFFVKARRYGGSKNEWMKRSLDNLRLDYNKDGTQDKNEVEQLGSGRLYR